MKFTLSYFTFFSLVLICSCNPKVTTSLIKSYPPVDFKQDIFVFNVSNDMPQNSEVLGRVKVGDSGFTTNCDYQTVIDAIKIEARKAGANSIKIIEHKLPSTMGSSCHRIIADLLRIENIENYQNNDKEDIIEDADYAILNVYRYSGVGALVNFDLYLGDSIVCRVRNNYKTTIRINKGGHQSLWARTETKTVIPINIEMGKTYYIRCSIQMGAFVGRPKIDLLEYKKGKAEFDSFNAKNQ